MAGDSFDPSTARIRTFLEAQRGIREGLWPAYRDRIAAASSPADARAVDALTAAELGARLAGGRPLESSPRSFAELLTAGMLAHFDDRCAYCARPLDIATWKAGAVIGACPWQLEYHVDHVTSRAQGGVSNHSNFV